MKPRVAFQVPNTLTGEGNLAVDITFENMDDFSPAAVAQKVEGLRQLLEARQQLANLVTYMDGKTGAEELIAKVIKDPALLKSLADARKSDTAAGSRPNASAETRPWPKKQSTQPLRCKASSTRAASSPRCSTRSSSRRSDDAKSAVEQAVLTLAQQALSQTNLIGSDVIMSIEAMIAELDQKLLEAGQRDPAPRGLPEARERLARPALSRQQHRDRRDAEDPRDEHLQERPRQDRSSATRARPGTRARSSRRSTRRSTASSAASRSAA